MAGFWKRLKRYKDMDLEAMERERFSNLEKSDYPAMILAAFLTLFLPCILILGVLVLIGLALFGVL